MEWWIVLIIVTVMLGLVFASGLPVAFGFMFLNVVGFFIWVGGVNGTKLIVPSGFDSVGKFTLVAVPLFVLMGEGMFHTGLAKIMIDNLGKWVGRVPGSLSLLGIVAGTIFAMMSGSAISGVAVFGSTLGPEMKNRGYGKEMIYAPIMAAGSLAVIIPPSILTVILATLSNQSVGKLLVASIIPGFILAMFYAVYILVRARLQPHLAPPYETGPVSWRDRIIGLAKIAPLGFIIFLVLGLIFLGVCTPSEDAALGATGVFILAAAYGKLTLESVKKTFSTTVIVSGLIFTIILSAHAFSQLLAFTGIVRGLGTLTGSLPVPPLLIVIMMQIVMIFMGMFMDDVVMVMICIPIFFPIIRALGFDAAWFGILMLVNMEMAGVSPPFGLLLFTLKGIMPDASMADIYRGGIPIFLIILALLVLLLFYPPLVTWLPERMMQ